MLVRGREFLERQGIEAPRLEVELLVAHALGLDRLRLFLDLDRPVNEAELARARELLMRRARGEPSAYLVGRREFYGRSFRVGPAVLVPRPETELLIDLARETAGERRGLALADFGTGSGCIAITLALELQGARVFASDVSAAALELARANAGLLEASVTFLEGDGLAPLAQVAPFDLCVSNPPYVDPADARSLAPAVRAFEPSLALFAPAGDPDHWVRRLCHEAPALLAPGGTLLVELGYDQGERALRLASAAGLRARLTKDLAGVPRVLVAERPTTV
jgi:release factor glutamine methyltransferase